MTNNQLTDEELHTLIIELQQTAYRLNGTNSAYLMSDAIKPLRELQERRLADKNCFMYGIVNPDGMAYMDEFCVSSDAGLLETEVATLNSNEGTDGYRVVALYTALPLMDSEREELQERRKADREPVVISDDMAYEFHHAMSDSSLGADEVEEIKTGLRAAFANAAPQLAPVLPDLISRFEHHISTAGLTDDDSVTVLECKDALRHVLEKSE